MSEADEEREVAPIEIRDAYIAPWALPSEEFPFHLLWTKHDEIDSLELRLSPGLELGTCLNVTKKEDLGPDADGWFRHRIMDIHLPGYFSGAIAYHHIPPELSTTVTIQVTFFAGARAIQTVELKSTIIRPRISLIHAPTDVSVDFDGPARVPILLMHEGEGMAEIDVEMEAVENVRLRKDGLVAQLLRDIQKASGSKSQLQANDLDNDELMELVGSFQKGLSQVQSGATLDSKTTQLIADAQEAMANLSGDDGPTSSVLRDVEAMWIASVLDQIKKSPIEHVRLRHGIVDAAIPPNVAAVSVAITYKDDAGNTYPSVNFDIQVNRIKESIKDSHIEFDLKWQDGEAHG